MPEGTVAAESVVVRKAAKAGQIVQSTRGACDLDRSITTRPHEHIQSAIIVLDVQGEVDP